VTSIKKPATLTVAGFLVL